MFGTLGGQEIIFILVLALIVFGPRKLPEIGKSIGRMMAEFRKASNDFRRTLEDEVEAEKARPVEPAAAATEHGVEPPADAMPVPRDAAPEPASAAAPLPDEGGAGVAAPDEPTEPRPEPAGVGRPDGRPVEPH